MKSVLVEFPDGSRYEIDFDIVDQMYRSSMSSKFGIPIKELPPLDSGLVNVGAWVQKYLSWHQLSHHATRLPELSENEKNQMNFQAAIVKLLEA